MIETQITEMASLASQYKIEEIVIAEMQRVNGDREVRSSLPSNLAMTGQWLSLSAMSMLMIVAVLVRIRSLVPGHLLDQLPIRRQRKQDHGLLLQLQQVYSDKRRQVD